MIDIDEERVNLSVVGIELEGEMGIGIEKNAGMLLGIKKGANEGPARVVEEIDG